MFFGPPQKPQNLCIPRYLVVSSARGGTPPQNQADLCGQNTPFFHENLQKTRFWRWRDPKNVDFSCFLMIFDQKSILGQVLIDFGALFFGGSFLALQGLQIA